MLTPQAHVPFALLSAVSISTMLYILIQIVCIGSVPALASSSQPLADAGRHFVGESAALTIAMGAILSCTGTLDIIMLTGPRILVALAEQGQLPPFLGATHRRFHTPHVAIILSSLLMLIATVSGSFAYALTVSTVRSEERRVGKECRSR